MKRKIFSIAVVSVLGIVLSGCSSNYASLTDKEMVSIEKQNSEKVRILWTDVYEKDSQTWVSGVLKQRGSGSGIIQTHVDIQVVNTDGTMGYQTITEEFFVPANRVVTGSDMKRFKVKLPERLPQGAQVSMKVHSGSHEKS
ncbi:MAG: hypothetical protein A2Y10_15455 [Planctomycetes bacterium GWF2_41_51]|nr:MAG: hypothetical protein A2Y10_15455 [Planctomycetes bacterium GWF2_41_51]HBG27567.1 hypothetical protein [Phycisphaerales bacterium]